jgi:hypothetical protein
MFKPEAAIAIFDAQTAMSSLGGVREMDSPRLLVRTACGSREHQIRDLAWQHGVLLDVAALGRRSLIRLLAECAKYGGGTVCGLA